MISYWSEYFVSQVRKAYDKEIPWNTMLSIAQRKSAWCWNVQVRIFFSSGAAQTNGGGSLRIVTYSLVS
jgi:hypothetical protein